MNILETKIDGLKVIEPDVFWDDRGYFFESYNKTKVPGELQLDWVQDNESKSSKGVLRGLHYQVGEFAQAKLVRCAVGAIYDIAVDIRPPSPTYGQWYGVELNEQNKKQLFIPRGFAHGFVVLSDVAIFSYKCDNFYNKESEGGIRYDDNTIKIKWPEGIPEFQLSKRDQNLPDFGNHKPY